MTPKDTSSAPVDETLARYRELQTEFERLRDRLRRAEEHKSTVSRRTFDKVRAEYDRDLDALRAQMTPLRQELESHRASVENRLRDANTSLDLLEEELAELMFRHRVGEFTEAEFVEKQAALDVRLESGRSRINEHRDTLELFDAMEEQEGAPSRHEEVEEEPVAPRPTTTRTAPRAPAPAPAPRDSGDYREAPALPRRPTLRPQTPDAAPAHAPAPAPKPVAKPEPKAAPAGDFENPHDWIKEMGRDVAPAPKRSAPPATEPARPRLAPTVASAPAKAPAGNAPARAKRTPSLVFVNGAHAGESVPLLPTTLSIGREHDNNIELKDPDVARYHARIVYERGQYVVEDLDSTTGTWVNGQRTRKSALNNGDVVRVGSTEIAIDFEWASDPV
jgi:hypothetical protein